MVVPRLVVSIPKPYDTLLARSLRLANSCCCHGGAKEQSAKAKATTHVSLAPPLIKSASHVLGHRSFATFSFSQNQQHLFGIMADTPALKRQKTEIEDAADQDQQKQQKQQDSTMSDPVPLTPADLAGSFPLQVKKLSEKAQLPKRGSALAAGYDLFSSEDGVVPAKGKATIATGISIALPPGTYGRVAPRSGLAIKHSIDTGAGVVDVDYRGEIKVILFNFSDVDYEVREGDRIAQLIVERIYTPDVVEVDELASTDRGVTGFGSTGR